MIPYANQGPPFPAFRPPEIPLSFLYTEYPPCWEALAPRVGNDWRWSVAICVYVCVCVCIPLEKRDKQTVVYLLESSPTDATYTIAN